MSNELSAVEKLRLKKEMNDKILANKSLTAEKQSSPKITDDDFLTETTENEIKEVENNLTENTSEDECKEKTEIEKTSIDVTEDFIKTETIEITKDIELSNEEVVEKKVEKEVPITDDDLTNTVEINEEFETDNLDEFIAFDDDEKLVESEDNIESKPNHIIAEKSSLFEWAEALAVAILVVSFVFIFIIRIVSVSGESMLPTLEHGDRLIISKLFYTPEYKDIVVLTKSDYMSEPMVKRVIATEGQTVDIDFKSGAIYVDGKLLEESYINELTFSEYDVSFPQTVPKDHVFVMGDNRNKSSDSRVSGIGMISEDLILGEVIMRLFPYSKIGAVE